ncbi:MAG: RNA polymerase sigma factor [Planctomycetota bacterium]|jgi:RNA polymerase sigma factor (sigma-70 family)
MPRPPEDDAAPPASPPRGTAGDPELIAACLDGDEAAWRTLVESYSGLVYSIPLRLGLGEDAAEEIFQDVFAVLVHQLPRLRRRTALPAWLITTTHRACRRWVRRSGRRPVTEAEPLLLERSLPVELAVEWEQRHRLRRALTRLGGRCEALLTALYLSSGTGRYEQIAQQLGIPVGSIGPTRARCLRKLLELLEPPGEEGSRP